jgi:Raf kinase inhibitor-like YbhB/YbcL family protein
MSSPRAVGLLAAASLAVLALLAAGCDTGDGRVLADPPPGATAPPLADETTTTAGAELANPPVGSEEAGGLVVGSPAFAAGEPIPPRFACDGENLSPPLTWSGLPAGTVELAITVVDIDAPGGQFIHWVVTGLDAALTGIDEGARPEGSVEARNDSSEFGWFGPCPPPGERHSYVFTLYALAAPSGVAAGTGGPEAVAQIATTEGTAATVTGTYTAPAA